MVKGNKNKNKGSGMEEHPEKRKLDDSEESEAVEKKQATGEKKIKKNEEESVTVNMSCPQIKVGGVIGRKGHVVAEIMRQSGCNVQIDQNFPEGVARQIQLSGTPHGLSIAMKLIKEVINSPEGSTPSFMPQSKDAPFYIEADKVGGVIGHRGANINEIYSRTGCRIQIIQEGQPEGQDRLVTFSGTPSEIAEAKNLIKLIIKDGINVLQNASSSSSSQARDFSHGPIIGASGRAVYEEDILPDKVRVVIGSKGSNIRMITDKSGCKVDMNQKFPAGHNHKVIYTGTTRQIEIAKHLVATVVNYGDSALLAELNKNLDSSVMQEINVFQSQMVRLLGPHGNNVSDVQNRCGVKISIDTTPIMLQNAVGPSGFPEATNKVTVIGSSESVQMAVKLLYEFIGIMVQAPPAFGGYPTQQPGAMSAFQQPPQNPFQAAGVMHPPQQQAPIQINNVGYAQTPNPVMGTMYPSPAPVPLGQQSYPQQLQQQQHPPQQVYQQQQQQAPMHPMAVVHPAAAPAPHHPLAAAQEQKPPTSSLLALGEDGTAGHLEPSVPQADGTHKQIAEIRTPGAVTKLLGSRNVNVALIKAKSGAGVHVSKTDPARAGATVLTLMGGSSQVALAAQMVQEVLVNGPAKLNHMPDVPQYKAPSSSSSAQPQQANHYQAAPGVMQQQQQMAPQYGMPPQQAQYMAPPQQVLPPQQQAYGVPPAQQMQQLQYPAQQAPLGMMAPPAAPVQQPYGLAPQQTAANPVVGAAYGGVGASPVSPMFNPQQQQMFPPQQQAQAMGQQQQPQPMHGQQQMGLPPQQQQMPMYGMQHQAPQQQMAAPQQAYPGAMTMTMPGQYPQQVQTPQAYPQQQQYPPQQQVYGQQPQQQQQQSYGGQQGGYKNGGGGRGGGKKY